MLLKNFVKLIDERQVLLIHDAKTLETKFVFNFSKKSYENNYWIGSFGKAYKDSTVVSCYAKEENKLVVLVE